MFAWLRMIIFLLISSILTHLLPTSLFRNVNTLIHEFGHAIVTLMTSGDVKYIELYPDHSGVTYSSAGSSWSYIPIALSGYMISSFFTWLLFIWYKQNRMRFGLQFISVIAISSLIFFIQNTYGITWVIGFILVNVLVLAFAPEWMTRLYYVLIAFICLEESVFGAIWLVWLAWHDPLKAGDASLLHLHTSVPAIAWASLFMIVALICAKQSIQTFVGNREES